MLARMPYMRPASLRHNPPTANLIRRPFGDDGELLSFKSAAFQGRHQQVFGGGHFDVVAVRLDVDFARGGDKLDTHLMRKQTDAILNPRIQVLTRRDLRRLLADEIKIRRGGERGFCTAAHGQASRGADGDDGRTAAVV